jgi:hypothetical protein
MVKVDHKIDPSLHKHPEYAIIWNVFLNTKTTLDDILRVKHMMLDRSYYE